MKLVNIPNETPYLKIRVNLKSDGDFTLISIPSSNLFTQARHDGEIVKMATAIINDVANKNLKVKLHEMFAKHLYLQVYDIEGYLAIIADRATVEHDHTIAEAMPDGSIRTSPALMKLALSKIDASARHAGDVIVDTLKEYPGANAYKLSKATGISQSSLHDIFVGKRRLSMFNAIRIGKALPRLSAMFMIQKQQLLEAAYLMNCLPDFYESLSKIKAYRNSDENDQRGVPTPALADKHRAPKRNPK